MYSRVTSLLFALFAFLLLVHAAPVPVDESGQVLEKRITHVGRGTWFNVGLGHCGKWNKDTDRIVAISGSLYAQNGGSNCDQYVEIIDTTTGKKSYGKTRDSCPSCGYHDLDLSPALFKDFKSLSVGVLPKLSWHFMKKGWTP